MIVEESKKSRHSWRKVWKGQEDGIQVAEGTFEQMLKFEGSQFWNAHLLRKRFPPLGTL